MQVVKTVTFGGRCSAIALAARLAGWCGSYCAAVLGGLGTSLC